ncbi:unnamed protein product [Meloidogyne enterolobii]|uniref:Uncharacterized protein n=1 Tax=Meloidogyne enterolobii TaxID=390850 RepID=A0ACB0ZPU1_MELEN
MFCVSMYFFCFCSLAIEVIECVCGVTPFLGLFVTPHPVYAYFCFQFFPNQLNEK